MKDLLRLQFFAIMFFLVVVNANGQRTMDVTAFMEKQNDLMARVTKPVHDHDEGKLCALIKVYSPFEDLEARADALGIVESERHGTELWYYVPYGARSVSFSSPGYFPLVYQYPESIKEGTVYELRLADVQNGSDGLAQNTNTQLFVLSHKPDEAKVYIDDVEQPTEYGVFAAMMNKGEHTYRVEASQYSDAEGEFELGNVPVRESVALNPLFGSFEIFTLPENGFEVTSNGQVVGKTPFKSGRLSPGSYKVKIRKPKYYSQDTTIRIKAGDEIRLTCKLTSHADSLFFNRRMGGRRVSLGVKAGYVMPFVSAKSQGGFTGSMINYGLGNAGEDASYRSQYGFTGGVTLDIRLVKNLYLLTGIDYKYIEYKNHFSNRYDDVVTRTVGSNAYVGDMESSFTEKYVNHFIELPVQASYRFILTKYSSVHVNAGAYVGYGISSKMKFHGSTDQSGVIYKTYFGEIDYDSPVGSFQSNEIYNGEFDLYSKGQAFSSVSESGSGLGKEQSREYGFSKSPYKPFNYGLKFGLTYELRGFQLGVNYDLPLSNMANDSFWSSNRIPLSAGMVGDNTMSGYKQRIGALSVTLGYVFRY